MPVTNLLPAQLITRDLPSINSAILQKFFTIDFSKTKGGAGASLSPARLLKGRSRERRPFLEGAAL